MGQLSINTAFIKIPFSGENYVSVFYLPAKEDKIVITVIRVHVVCFFTTPAFAAMRNGLIGLNFKVTEKRIIPEIPDFWRWRVSGKKKRKKWQITNFPSPLPRGRDETRKSFSSSHLRPPSPKRKQPFL